MKRVDNPDGDDGLHCRLCWLQLSLPRPRGIPQAWTQICAPNTLTATPSITRPMFLMLSSPATTTLQEWVPSRAPTNLTAVTTCRTQRQRPCRGTAPPDSTLPGWAPLPAPITRPVTDARWCWPRIMQTPDRASYAVRLLGWMFQHVLFQGRSVGLSHRAVQVGSYFP